MYSSHHHSTNGVVSIQHKKVQGGCNDMQTHHYNKQKSYRILNNNQTVICRN